MFATAETDGNSVWPKVLLCLLTTVAANAVLIICKIIKLYKQKQSPPYPSFPYYVRNPNPHWLLGHSLLLGSPIHGSEILANKYASPEGISTFWYFGVPCATSNRVEHIKQVFKQNYYSRTGSRLLRRHFEKLLGKRSLILSDGMEWSKGRIVVNRSMNATLLKAMQEKFNKVASRTVDSIKQMNLPTTLDFMKIFKIISIDCVGLGIFGYEFGSTECGFKMHEVVEAFYFLTRDTSRRCYKDIIYPSSHIYSIPTAQNKKNAHAISVLRKFLYERIKETRHYIDTQGDTPECRNLLKQRNFLTSMLIRSDDALTDDEIADFLITILYAAYDTTTAGMAMTLNYLSKNPRALKRCRQEVRTVLAANEGDITEPEQTLPYLYAVFLETTRMSPPVGIVPREIHQRTELEGGLVLEKGQRFYYFLFAINQNPKNFPHPELFLPERWVEWDSDNECWMQRTPSKDEIPIQDTAEFSEDNIPAADVDNLLTWSTEPRSCPGARMSKREAISVLAHLINNFEFQVAEGCEVEIVRNGTTTEPKELWLVVSHLAEK